MFLYYANGEGDDIIGGSTRTVQRSIMNISRKIKAETNMTKERK